ncbi:hypothetical protein MRX96_024680 [Rhipicephalus microplus]
MEPMLPWMALLAWLNDVLPDVGPNGSEITTIPCALPWTVSRESYLDLPDDVFETLMRCPAEFHGCSDELAGCVPSTHGSTCSCAFNCKTYGDCCWNVELDTTLDMLEAPRISCEHVAIDKEHHYQVYMSLGDHFHLIPVTGNSSEVTYRNVFCALCNADIDTIFWDSAFIEESGEYFVTPPELWVRPPAHYLRPCVDDIATDTCSLNVPEAMLRKCKTYYAPVSSGSTAGPTFKNVYCALCNGVKPFELVVQPCAKRQCRRGKNRVLTIAWHRYSGLSLARLRATPCTTAGATYEVHPITEKRIQAMNSTKIKSPTSERTPSSSGGGEASQYVTLICVSLSIFCLALKLVVFCAYRESRSFASQCTLAALVHYGFLSTFCWTCTLSFDICRSLTYLTLSTNRESVPVTYSAFSCGLPLLVVASAVAVDLALPESALSPRYGRLVCWIGSFWGLVVYFLVPVAILLLCCLAFYFRVVLYVRRTSIAQRAFNGIRDHQRAHAGLFVRLALVMGSPWALAFLATFVESVVLDCFVSFLVGLQGVYLFVAFKDYRFFLSSIRKRVAGSYSSDVSS